MKIRTNRNILESGLGLIAVMLTVAIFVGFIGLAIYIGRLIIRRAESVSERQQRKMTNELTNIEYPLEGKEWMISEKTIRENEIVKSYKGYSSSFVVLDVPDDRVRNLVDSVGNYTIDYNQEGLFSDNWLATSNSFFCDRQSVIEIMLDLAKAAAMINSNSPYGFWRFRKMEE